MVLYLKPNIGFYCEYGCCFLKIGVDGAMCNDIGADLAEKTCNNVLLVAHKKRGHLVLLKFYKMN